MTIRMAIRDGLTGILTSVFLVSLFSCNPSPKSETSSKEGKTFSVALLTPGPITDHSWNAGAYAGLMLIRDSLHAQVSHVQTKTPAEFDENLRQYGRQEFSVVFGHGFEFQDAVRRVAPLFPRSRYFVTSGDFAGPNYAGIRFAFEQPAYLAGIIAAGATRTGVIGLLGGTELPPVRAGFAAFAAGVRRVRPSARVITSYLGNWDDVSAAKEQALAQIAQGADVIFQNADAAGLGVFQAARENGRTLVVGSNSNQNNVAPDVVIGSVVIDLPRAYLTVASEVRSGQFKPSVVSLGAETKVVRFIPNATLMSRVQPSVRALADSVWTAFSDGTLEIDESGRTHSIAAK